MPEYRRSKEPGGTFFFTLVTFNRIPLFASPKNYENLRSAWKDVQTRHPFETIAVCVLPDHIHAIWKLPEGDADYPMRWKEIKRQFTREYLRYNKNGILRSESQQIQGEAAIWHRRYWEHTVRDEEDLNTHIDYVHINPLKHGLITRVSDWPWSSFHRYVRNGIYTDVWGGRIETKLLDVSRGE